MSDIIDNRVVSMDFDNSRFEKNVKTSLSTLDKLKNALKFDSVSDGMEKVGSAAKKIDMNPLCNSIDAVKSKFSALEVIGVTALVNITNSAVNAGKRLVKSLSIDQVSAGWQKYKDVTSSTQTIMSSTGKSIDEVKDSLERLNWFTDETSYSLVDMTSNIGKFTSAGVDLDKAVNAMQGIALEAALSGANTQQASRAMYNFSQAMGMGSVKLQDWMSIENANMATKEFKETLIETGKAMGAISKNGKILNVTNDKYTGPDTIDYKNFRSTLASGWLTGDVLTSALEEYGKFATKLQEAMEIVDLDTTSQMLKYIDQYKKGILDIGDAADKAGISESKFKSIMKDLSSDTYDLGRRAFIAGQEAKTLTEAIDATKDAVSSGWMKMFEIMLGDYEEAKVLWTNLANDMWTIFAEPLSNANDLLKDTFDSSWTQLARQIKGTGIEIDDFQKTLNKTAKKHKIDLDSLIKKYGSLDKAISSGKVPAKVVREAFENFASTLGGLNEKQLKSAGYTKEQVKLIKELADEASKSDTTVSRLFDTLNRPSGRALFTDSLTNGLHSLMEIIDDVKEAWSNIFPPKTADDLYDTLKRIDDYSIKILDGLKERSDKIKKTFEGVFAILDIFKMFIEGALTTSFKILGEIFDGAGDKVLDFSAGLGESLVGLRDWIKEHDTFTKVFEAFSDKVTEISDKLKDFKNSLKIFSNFNKDFNFSIESFGDFLSKATDKLDKFKKAIKDTSDKIVNFVKTISDKVGKIFSKITSWISENISPSDILAGVASGGLIAIVKKFSDLIDKISKVFDDFTKVGDNAEKFSGQLKTVLETIKSTLNSFISGIKIASLVSISISIGILTASLVELSKLKGNEMIKGITGVTAAILSLTTAFKRISKALNKNGSDGIMKSSIAISVMSLSIKAMSKALETLGKMPFVDIVKGLIAMKGLLLEISAAAKKLSGVSLDIKTALSLVALAEAVKIAGKALADIGKLSWGEIGRGLAGMGGALVELSGVTILLSKFANNSSVIKSASILILTACLDDIADAMKKFGSMTWGEIGRGLSAMGGALTELTAVTVLLSKFGNIKGVISSAAIAILTACLDDIADAMKKFGSMTWGEIGRGLTAMGGALVEMGGVIGVLGYFSGLSGLLSSAALAILTTCLDDIAVALEKFGSMTWGEIGRGLTAMGGALVEMGGVIGVLGYFSGLSGLVSSASLAILTTCLDDIANAMKKFGSMTWGEIGRGLTAMGGALGELSAALIILGTVAGFSSILSSASIAIVTTCLDDIADAMKKFGGMTWEEIGKGLAGMAGALTVLSSIIALTGTVAGIGALIGGASIGLVADQLQTIATAMQDLAKMTWEDIGQALVAMAGALGIMATGALANTFSAIGGLSLGTIVQPISDLADAMKKWTNVTIPDGLATKLASLGGAVATFTFDGIGADALAKVATSLGEMAEHVKKWVGVKIPDGLTEKLGSLSGAIFKFTFDGLGADALSKAAVPIGDMADSVKKWAGVKVPDGLCDSFSSLASAIRKFLFVDIGIHSIKEAVEPLANLSDSVKKWEGITITEELSTNLEKLAGGVASFGKAIPGDVSLKVLITPLGQLSDSVRKWEGVTVPENIETQLTALSKGVQSFNWTFAGDVSLKILIGSLGSLADDIKKWKDTSVPENIEAQLTALSKGVQSFNWAFVAGLSIDSIVGPLGELAGEISKWKDVTISDTLKVDLPALSASLESMDGETAAKNITALIDGLKKINEIDDVLTSAKKLGVNIVSKISEGIKSSAITYGTVLSDFYNKVTAYNQKHKTAGSTYISKISEGIKGSTITYGTVLSDFYNKVTDYNSKYQTVGTTYITKISDGIKGSTITYDKVLSTFYDSTVAYYDKYKEVGVNYIANISEGITESTISVGKVFSNAAAKARNYYTNFYSAGQYCAQGFANGMYNDQYRVTRAGTSLGNAAYNAARRAIQSHSPSKKFYKLGYYSVAGYVNAVRDNLAYVSKSGKSMGLASLDALRDAMDSAKYTFLTDADMQPTIRPVVDMSDVRDKASLISGYFGQTGAYYRTGVQIASTMSSRQNPVYVNENKNRITKETFNTSINSLKSEVSELKNVVRNLKIVMDTGVLVGTLAPGIDKQLNTITMKKNRNI